MKRAALCALLLAAAAALALDWREVAAVRVPEGEAASVAVDGETVWKRLPYDAEIEYLESTGTQYIDTGTTVTSGSSYEIRLDYVRTAGAGVIYTYPQDDNADLRFFYNGTGNKLFYDRGSQRLQYSYSKKNGLNIRLGNFWLEESGTTLVSGTEQSWSSPTGTTLRVFSNIASSGKYDKIKLYSLKIWDGSTIVRDYIPCRIGSTGYLYDRASGRFFGNAGTGAFVLGPDKE